MSDAPEPLVPADVNLRDFQFMPLDVVRLRDSDLATVPDGEVFRAAVLSWCVAWHQQPAASLPDDDAMLAKLLGYGRDVKGWQKLRSGGALRGYVKCADGRLYHPVVAEKANEAWRRKKEQRDRTEKARLARMSQAAKASVTEPDKPSNRPDEAMSQTKKDDTEPLSLAKKPIQGTGTGTGTGKEERKTPPLAIPSGIASDPPEGAKPKTAKRKTRLDGEFVIDPDGPRYAYAIDCGMTEAVMAIECDKFENHHRAKGNLMADWDAAWRTWVRNWQSFSQQRARA